MTEAASERSLMDKLGVRPESRVSLLGLRDSGFLAQLEDRRADVARGRRRKGSDLIFLSVENSNDLRRLGELEPYLQRNGAVWVVYAKGRKDLRQVDVIGAGLGSGIGGQQGGALLRHPYGLTFRHPEGSAMSSNE
ncbi:MAG: hypothetical protein ACRDGU_02885 [Actinomycetota bacterium]